MINIGLSEKDRNTIAQQLHALLANEYVLYTKTLKYHWNVKGENFGPLHMFFQKQYEQLQEFIDGIAERSLALGIPSTGTLAEFAQVATIKEQPGQNPQALDMVKDLLQGHETIILQLRSMIDATAQINDMGTNNFLSNLLEKHEKIAWMLRAHLEK